MTRLGNETSLQRRVSTRVAVTPVADESQPEMPLVAGRTRRVGRPCINPDSEISRYKKTIKYPRTGKRGAPQAFPRKLYEILCKEHNDTIGWTEGGASFLIKDMDTFTIHILMKYFRHQKYSSFQRQLNLYGFRKVSKGFDVGAYAHEYFLKGRDDLLIHVRRMPQATVANKTSAARRRASYHYEDSDEDDDEEEEEEEDDEEEESSLVLVKDEVESNGSGGTDIDPHNWTSEQKEVDEEQIVPTIHKNDAMNQKIGKNKTFVEEQTKCSKSSGGGSGGRNNSKKDKKTNKKSAAPSTTQVRNSLTSNGSFNNDTKKSEIKTEKNLKNKNKISKPFDIATGSSSTMSNSIGSNESTVEFDYLSMPFLDAASLDHAALINNHWLGPILSYPDDISSSFMSHRGGVVSGRLRNETTKRSLGSCFEMSHNINDINDDYCIIKEHHSDGLIGNISKECKNINNMIGNIITQEPGKECLTNSNTVKITTSLPTASILPLSLSSEIHSSIDSTSFPPRVNFSSFSNGSEDEEEVSPCSSRAQSPLLEKDNCKVCSQNSDTWMFLQGESVKKEDQRQNNENSIERKGKGGGGGGVDDYDVHEDTCLVSDKFDKLQMKCEYDDSTNIQLDNTKELSNINSNYFLTTSDMQRSCSASSTDSCDDWLLEHQNSIDMTSFIHHPPEFDLASVAFMCPPPLFPTTSSSSIVPLTSSSTFSGGSSSQISTKSLSGVGNSINCQ